MGVKEQLLEAIKKHLDVPGLVEEVLDTAVEQALDNLVKKTDNPYDDMLKAAAGPLIKKEIKDEVSKLWSKLGEPQPAPKA
jgi:hypothetical protein